MKKRLFLFVTFILMGIQLWGDTVLETISGGFKIKHSDEIEITIVGYTTYRIEKESDKVKVFFSGTDQYIYFYLGNEKLSVSTKPLKQNISINTGSFEISANDNLSSETIEYQINPMGGPGMGDAASASSHGQSVSSPSVQNRSFKIYFYNDLTPPATPSVTFENKKENNWYNSENTKIDFSLTGGEDDDSGFDHFEYRIDNNNPYSEGSYYLCASTFSFPKDTDGMYTINFYSVDKVGNKSEPYSYTINLDSKSPTIEDSCLDIGTSTRFVQKANISFSVNDSNLDKCDYCIKKGSVIKTKGAPKNGKCAIEYDENGISTLKITASDYAENTFQKEYNIYVDSIYPTIKISSVEISDNKQGTTFSISASANDNEGSGIKSFGINEQNVNGNYLNNEQTDVGQQIINEAFYSDVINRDDTKINLTYSLSATDFCSNVSPACNITFSSIPKRIKLSDFSSTISGDYIENRIKTNLKSKEELKQYTLSYSRTFIVNNANEIVDRKYLDEQIKNIVVSEKDTIVENNCLYIIDKIPISTGMGHHEVKYSFECKTIYSYIINNEDEINGKFDDNVDSNALTNTNCYCANNPCKITWKITGRKQNTVNSSAEPYSLEIDGTKSFEADENNPIYTNPNGSITISVKIQDFDCEKHDIQLYKYLYLSANEGDKNKSTLFKNPVEKMVINNYPTYKLDNSGYRTDGYYEFSIPIYLRYNNLENYGLEIVEFVDDNNINQTVTRTEKVSLKADNPDLGGFKLNVFSNADYNANGISLQVNTQLKIIIEETDNSQSSYIFDWGDEKYSAKDTKKDKETASHTYGQKEGRTGAISEYSLNISTIRSSNSQTIPNEIKIYAIDTQYGELAGNEIWIGKHEILSSIIIPKDIVLTIDGRIPVIESNNKVQILCYGNPDVSETGSGITTIFVNGQLKTENEIDGITFIEMHNSQDYGFIANTAKSYGWGGIMAYPNSIVSLSNSVINFANRGVITQAKSKVTIENSLLQFNDIGIHAFPGATITVNNTEISNNSIYGIKEEKSNENIVILTDKNNLDTNRIENNGSSEYPRNHYKATDGLEY